MAKRVKIGDVIQLTSSKGLSYAQLTHINPEYKYLIRVFSEIYTKPPKDFNEVVDHSPQFSAFFPVQYAVNKGVFPIVANVRVSPKNQPFPIFRSATVGRDGISRGAWWLWDGEKEIILRRPLSEEEKKYSFLGIINLALLIKRIETGYRPEVDDL